MWLVRPILIRKRMKFFSVSWLFFWLNNNFYKGDVMKRFLFCVTSLLLVGHIAGNAATYSTAVKAGRNLFVSAQMPINPSTGEMVDGDIGTLTNLVLDHVQQALLANGFTMSHVVQTEVYLSDIRDYAGMDVAYGLRFSFPTPPTRSVSQVSDLQNNARIQIYCIAYK